VGDYKKDLVASYNSSIRLTQACIPVCDVAFILWDGESTTASHTLCVLKMEFVCLFLPLMEKSLVSRNIRVVQSNSIVPFSDKIGSPRQPPKKNEFIYIIMNGLDINLGVQFLHGILDDPL
jgi:hypothetical protein